MSRFKRTKIKSSKKSSVSIDEKIAALNKELGKTGMLSEMDTSNVYQTTFETPNPLHNAFKSLSHDGQPLGFSGADFNIFTEPIGGLKYSPPHPVTGERRAAQSWFGIASGFGPVAANSDRQILWCFDQSLAGGFGSWFTLELTKGSNPFWGTWISTAFGTEMLVPYNSIQSPLSSAIKFDLDTLNINQFTEPETWQDPNNVQVRSDSTNDPSFLPIDIFKKFIANTFDSAQEGYEYLSEKAKEFFFGTGFDTEKDYEKNRKENRPDVQGYEASELAHELDKKIDTYTSILGNPISDTLFDYIADKLGGGAAKDTVDDYTRDFIPDLFANKKPPGSSKDNPRDMSKVFDEKTIEKWEDIFKDHQETGEKIPYSYQATADTDNNIGSSFGTPDKLVGDGFEDNGDGTTTWHKAFDFDGADDLAPQTGDLLMNVGTSVYGVLSGLNFLLKNQKTGLPSPFGKESKTPTMHMGITFDNRTGKVIPNYKPGGVKESYITEGVKLGHFDPEVLNVDIKDLRKGIMPEYPKKAPPEMIDGYSKESRLAPKVIKGEPTIKITKKDLAKFHKLKKSEIEKFMKEIKQINAYLQKNPGDLIHVQQRYPKNDPRLAQLNWKMDQMSDASSKYLDKNFKVNQTSFKLAQDRVKKNTALTNPDYIQKHYDELRGTTKPEPRINRKSPSRFFKKPKKKSSMEAINDKIKQLDKDLLI